MKRAEVCHDRWWDNDGKPWKVYIHEDGVIPDRAEQILYRDSDAPGRGFPTHASALAHAIAAVGLDKPAEHREAP